MLILFLILVAANPHLFYNGDTIYTIYPAEDRKTFNSAVTVCNSVGGQIANIETQAQANLIAEQIKTRSFIGKFKGIDFSDGLGTLTRYGGLRVSKSF